MTLDRQLSALFLDTVTIEPFEGREAYGKPVYGAKTTYPCRIEHLTRVDRYPGNTYAVDWANIYMDYVATLKVLDRLTMPDGSQPPIVEVQHQTDDKGPYATVILTLPKRA